MRVTVALKRFACFSIEYVVPKPRDVHVQGFELDLSRVRRTAQISNSSLLQGFSLNPRAVISIRNHYSTIKRLHSAVAPIHGADGQGGKLALRPHALYHVYRSRMRHLSPDEVIAKYLSVIPTPSRCPLPPHKAPHAASEHRAEQSASVFSVGRQGTGRDLPSFSTRRLAKCTDQIE